MTLIFETQLLLMQLNFTGNLVSKIAKFGFFYILGTSLLLELSWGPVQLKSSKYKTYTNAFSNQLKNKSSCTQHG